MPGNENFGAIVFDRPESLDRGWYCLGEGEPGRLPDDGAAGLPPGPVWYTSLSFSEAAEMGLSSSSRFLNSAYLRQPMQKLLARLGVPDDDAGRCPAEPAGKGRQQARRQEERAAQEA